MLRKSAVARRYTLSKPASRKARSASLAFSRVGWGASGDLHRADQLRTAKGRVGGVKCLMLGIVTYLVVLITRFVFIAHTVPVVYLGSSTVLIFVLIDFLAIHAEPALEKSDAVQLRCASRAFSAW